MGRPMELVVPGSEGSEGSTELRKATGFWMGLGVELLDVGEEACGGDWARRNGELTKAGGTRVGEEMYGGLLAGSSTRVWKTRGDMGKLETDEAGLSGELVSLSLASLWWSSAASSWSKGTGDSVGDGLLTGERLWAAMNSLGRE